MDCAVLVHDVAVELNDPGHDRWKLPDLIRYLNDGCMQVLGPRPEATVRAAVVVLVEGSRQALPADFKQLISVDRNGASGATLRQVDKPALDAVAPLWHGTPPADMVKEYAWDYRSPREFWVWPPVAAGVEVECTVSAYPAVIEQPGEGASEYGPFPLPDEFADAVKAWMLFRCYMQDTGAGSTAKAQTWSSYFYHSLGVSAQGRAENEPGEDV